MGGLSRRAYIIQQVKKEENRPVLLLDAGGLLFEQPLIPESLLPARKIQASGVSRAMRVMRYDAIGIAQQDLSAGLTFLQQKQQEFDLPFLSANLTGREGEKPLFQSFTMHQVSDLAIAVIGLTGEQASVRPGSFPEEYRILPWQTVLPGVLDQVRSRADMIILLSSYPEPVNRQIAEQFGDIHLIIQSGTSTANRIPQLFGNSLITQIGSRGKYLGRMDIDWHPSRRWVQESSPQLKQTRDMLDRLNWRLGRMEKRQRPEELQQNQGYDKLLQEKETLTAEINRLEQLAGERQEKFSSYIHSFVPLKVALPENPEVQEIVQQTKQELNSLTQQKFEEIRQAPSTAPNEAFSSMTGVRSCHSCHSGVTDFWQKTAHARAWQTLVRVQQQFNQDCLICHVTLPTYDVETVLNNNLLATMRPEFRGVGCEACHGPGRDHAAQPEQFRPRRADEKTCLLCHTPDHDNNFIFAEKVQRIRCPDGDHSTSKP